jgi:hypothetical protein
MDYTTAPTMAVTVVRTADKELGIRLEDARGFDQPMVVSAVSKDGSVSFTFVFIWVWDEANRSG